MRKMLSVLLVNVLLLACVPLGAVSVSAATYGGLTYKINNGEVTITDCDESVSGELVIPNTIKGYPVTGIDSYAFEFCANLTSVTIPDSVTSIGGLAFYYCDSLTSIKVSENNKALSSVDGVMFNKDKTILLQCPRGKVSDCYAIPDSVTTIDAYAFEYCTGLTSVNIPESVTSIGSWAFEGCRLTSVTIPDSVVSLDRGAFAVCGELTSVVIGNGITSISYQTFALCNKLTSLTIGDGVTSIGEGAFEGCDNLITLTIGDSVTSIGAGAFASCSSLTLLTIPVSVTKIGSGAFNYCSGLTDVYYGGSMSQASNMVIAFGNDPLYNATWHYVLYSNNVQHSVMDTENGYGLAFRFELNAFDVKMKSGNKVNLTDAAVVYRDRYCKLIGMGAVVTNNETAAKNLTLDAVNDYNVVNVPTVYLQEADEEFCAFATRIINIPGEQLERTIYARPYYVVEVDGEQITVYGDVDSATCAEYL